jgi:hypothetical protein
MLTPIIYIILGIWLTTIYIIVRTILFQRSLAGGKIDASGRRAELLSTGYIIAKTVPG